jgi:hypothetical protein
VEYSHPIPAPALGQKEKGSRGPSSRLLVLALTPKFSEGVEATNGITEP